MTLAEGLLLGVFGILFTLVGFFIAYIVYGQHIKNIERIEADKKKKVPYDFK